MVEAALLLIEVAYLRLVNPKITWNKRKAVPEAAARGEGLEEDQARYVRVVEYEVPEREGDRTDALIALVTTITDARLAPARALATAYHQRWEQAPIRSFHMRPEQHGAGLDDPSSSARDVGLQVIRRQVALHAGECPGNAPRPHTRCPGLGHPRGPARRRRLAAAAVCLLSSSATDHGQPGRAESGPPDTAAEVTAPQWSPFGTGEHEPVVAGRSVVDDVRGDVRDDHPGNGHHPPTSVRLGRSKGEAAATLLA